MNKVSVDKPPDDFICSICYAPPGDDELARIKGKIVKVIRAECGHLYHETCIDSWYQACNVKGLPTKCFCSMVLAPAPAGVALGMAEEETLVVEIAVAVAGAVVGGIGVLLVLQAPALGGFFVAGQ